MMSPDNMPAAKPPPPQQQQQTAGLKDENQGSSSGRKTASTTRPPPEQILKCPRCDSPNTKFCYYNNYSLTQPRHFCKTCRRYWTKGGALRNVPIGGGCRKNKKVKSCSSSSSRLSGGSDSRDSSSCSDIGGGLKFFHGISPAMDFQLGGLSIPRLQTSTTAGIYNYNYNLPLSSFGDSISNNASSSSSCFNLEYQSAAGTSNSLMGFNYPLSLATGSGGGGGGRNFNGAIQSSMNVHSSLASSIESLSCINQDLHWKLQQQRLSMLFGGGGGGDSMTTQKDVNAASSSSLTLLGNQTTQKSSPPSSSQILFRNLDVSKPHEVYAGSTTTALQPQARKEVSRSGDNTAATEWFFGNSYAPPPPVTPTPTNSNSNGNENGNNWNGFQAWNDLQQYSALP